MKKYLNSLLVSAVAVILLSLTANVYGAGNKNGYAPVPGRTEQSAFGDADEQDPDPQKEDNTGVDDSADEEADDGKDTEGDDGKDTEVDAVKPGWFKKNGKYYWRNADGRTLKKKGMVCLEEEWYFLNKDHSRFSKGFRTVKGKCYYFQKDGKRYDTPGFKRIGGKTYLFRKNGVVWTTPGFKKVNGVYYLFLKKGVKFSEPGFHKYKEHCYRFMEDGGIFMDTGFTEIDGSTYFFTKGHYMATGLLKTGGKIYFFGKNGRLLRNRLPFEWEGSWYRIDSSGVGEELSEAQAQASRLTWNFINKYSSKSDSNYTRFRKCFNRMEWADFRPSYIRRTEVTAPDGPYRIVVKVLRNTNHWTHNCYGFACVIASLAKELGYEPYLIVMDYDHAVVQVDGKYYDNMGARFGASSTAIKGWKTYKRYKF